MHAILLTSLLAFSAGSGAVPELGPPCTVPGSHGTIQQAVDDPICARILLADATYAELVDISRSLAVQGPAAGHATITGRVQVRGTGTEVDLVDLRIDNGCPGAALGVGGATASCSNVQVLGSASAPCPGALIFADGFESGGTSAWSSQVQPGIDPAGRRDPGSGG